jgi:glucose-1-phosphate cytidylyltransferase
MKAVILAGGYGTRISEETHLKPKPMIEIGSKPILWHIMKVFGAHGINDFIICLGYKGYLIKEYFANYFLHMSDIHLDLAQNKLEILNNNTEPWKVTLIDTGLDSMTGGRLKRVAQYLRDDEDFCFTYGDGLADIDLGELIRFHRSEGRLATLTAVSPPGRFGALDLTGRRVARFKEKPMGDGGYINGGFFVLSRKVLEYIDGDDTTWELEPLERLAAEGNLSAYVHKGFWHPMDTLRDQKKLQRLWDSPNPPWKKW